MGNQVSKIRKGTDSSKSRTDSKSQGQSQKTTSETSFHNSSTLSSNQPKFAQEVFPHSTSESSRQQGEHYLLKHMFQSSYHAPLEDILNKPDSKCLDVGCGTQAAWLLDVANDFPNCTFYGFDILEPFSLEADQNFAAHIPPNCKLEKADIFDGFPYPDKTFDFVHQRLMNLAYHGDKVPWMFSEILRVTKDNGLVELAEPDVTPKRAGPILSKIFTAVRAVFKDKLGTMLEGSALPKLMEEHGFVDIQTDYASIPACWGGYIGKLAYDDMIQMFQYMGPMIYDYLDLGGEYNKDAYESLLDTACDECVEYQTFFNYRWVYGRKPPASS